MNIIKKGISQAQYTELKTNAMPKEGGAYMEMGNTDGNPNTPYIDFHTDGGAGTDFNSRIMADGGGLKILAPDGLQVAHDIIMTAGKQLTIPFTTSDAKLQIISEADTVRVKVRKKSDNTLIGQVLEFTPKGGINNNKDLLWENASSTSSFATQAVTLPLSNYKFVDIFAYRATTLNRVVFVRVPVGEKSLVFDMSATRAISTAKTYISFSDSVNITTNATDNNAMIPVVIYGIK